MPQLLYIFFKNKFIEISWNCEHWQYDCLINVVSLRKESIVLWITKTWIFKIKDMRAWLIMYNLVWIILNLNNK